MFEPDAAQDTTPGSASRSLAPRLPPRLLLSAYAESSGSAEPWQAGERWRLQARLRRPHGLANPHAFDYELWLFEQDLRATGVVRPGTGVRLEASSLWSLDRLRQRLRAALQRQVPDAATAGVLVALSLGEQAAIARADWGPFRDTGVSHLMSISGDNVTLVFVAQVPPGGILVPGAPRLCPGG